MAGGQGKAAHNGTTASAFTPGPSIPLRPPAVSKHAENLARLHLKISTTTTSALSKSFLFLSPNSSHLLRPPLWLLAPPSALIRALPTYCYAGGPVGVVLVEGSDPSHLCAPFHPTTIIESSGARAFEAPSAAPIRRSLSAALDVEEDVRTIRSCKRLILTAAARSSEG